MAGSRKVKNTKDGGVTAALAKQLASKSSNGSASRSSSSNASSPPVSSPDIKPTTVPPYNATPAISTPSPSLGALSTTPISSSTANSTDWIHGAFSGSPGNLVNLMGESPPTQPSSYEDSGRLHPAWGSPRPYMSPQSGASPPPAPNRAIRPQSLHVDAPYGLPDMHNQTNFAPHRRNSITSQLSHARSTSHPPLPHQLQAHFYGAPDLDLGMASHGGLKAGERGYHLSFDALPHRYPDPTPGSDSVIVAGYEGGLEVYSVAKRGLDSVASLKGLRGGVYDAKILPWTSANREDVFPMVAVVVHGPVLPGNTAEAERNASPMPPTARASMPGSPRPEAAFSRPPNQSVQYYQSSVEVYSLRTNQRVATLLEASPVPIESSVPITSHMFSPPPPTGHFGLMAEAGSIVVSSGSTGECWLYRQLPHEAGRDASFGLVAKFWTSIQRSPRSEASEDVDRSRMPPPTQPRPSPRTPILAMRGRWIAYCPPTQSSQISLRASIKVPVVGKGPGTTTVTAPSVPSPTLATYLPNPEGLMTKMVRGTTQEVIEGVKWVGKQVGKQGMQAWNSYWKVPTQQPQPLPRSPPTANQQWGSSYPPSHDGPQFPPTHGTPNQAVTKDPGVVSILDAETVGGSSALHPFATFTAPDGCSFLSFSPTGLSLFTVSSKGDVQTVWDLMHIQHTKSSPLQFLAASSGGGPKVRQIAQFSRMTVARVVEVAWAKPNGERIAMVTERGTVHLLDMPSSAFTWPPPRRRLDARETATSSEAPSSAVSVASTAIGAALGAARPLISRSRRSSANSAGFSGSSLVESASQGGRAIAAGISSSLGKTGTALDRLRQSGENRVALPLSDMPAPGCVVWVSGRKHCMLFGAAAGVVRLFAHKGRPVPRRVSKGPMYQDFNVPSIPDDTLSEAVRQFVNGDDELCLSDRDMDAGNTVTLNSRPRVPEREVTAEASIPQVEIESSAPYQPFHTDRRVSLHEYALRASTISAPAPVPSQPAYLDPTLFADLSLADSSLTPKKKKKKSQQEQLLDTFPESQDVQPGGAWAFGQNIASEKLDLGVSPSTEDSTILLDEHRALPASAMERVLQVGADEEHVVVTTRRRRGQRHGAGQDDDGFFEDDCEVLDFADQRV